MLLDAWRQAQIDVPAVNDANETTLRRLLYAFARTMDAVFSTSSTTPCVPLHGTLADYAVRTFGGFAAMVVVCNYVMVFDVSFQRA